jgi:UDP-glucose 4-epimerase
MKVLVTGGTGYIGSHTVVELQNKSYDVTIIDNLSNSNIEVVDKIGKITGIKPEFHKIDLLDYRELDKFIRDNCFEAVLHFAGLKAVEESVREPMKYYENNVLGSINLFKAMRKYDVKNLIFSSSATVYGEAEKMPVTEEYPTGATNPYGNSKLIIESICRDLQRSDRAWNFILLRYFNPVGCHSSGLIREEPMGIPNNLFPYIIRVAEGKAEYLSIYGNDYQTADGTGVRDYIHVVDLAKGHIKALEFMKMYTGLEVFNLGTGKGYSVLEVVKEFMKVNQVNVPFRFSNRREGDIGISYADASKAANEMGWKAVKGLDEMVKIIDSKRDKHSEQ